MGGPVGASGSDPSSAEGFYSYDVERGSDIHSFWYRSPGRSPGGDGDPFRVSDPLSYIGMAPPAPAEDTGGAEDIGMDQSLTDTPTKGV
jgi:hypothetical protein